MSTSQSNNLTEFESFQPDQILFPERPRDERLPHAVRLIKNRWAAAKIREDVKLQIKEFESTQHALLQCKEKLKSKEDLMRHRMQTSNLIKYSEEQQFIAERKARCNRDVIKKNQEYLQGLKEELGALLTRRLELRKHVEENCIYAKYFDLALKKNKQFDEPHELITHYNARKRIQQELVTSIQERRNELFKSQNNLEWTRKQYSYTQVINETKTSTLRRKLEKAEQQVLKWEETWSEVKRSAKLKMIQQAQINQATFSLSKNMWHTGTEISKPVKPEDTIELLDKIQEFICDLKLILERVSIAEEQSSNAEEEVLE